ncbi:MAG TPA: hypothetical protein PKD39_02150 [Chitinophagales bacterium]|nr:hypothetical protein [Chitinophagales bacterium]HMX59359.1 hypothetical protein [Chitinophagales bacterium]
MKQVFITYIITHFVFNVFGQIQITKPNPKLYFDAKYVTLENSTPQKPDSLIDNFHRYNTTEKQFAPYNNLGNYGTAYYSLMFNHNNFIGFKHGFNSFDLYFIQPEKIKYFNTKTPYTQLDFVFGGKEEIVGGAEFAINIRPNVNLGFSFHRNSFKGKSQHQLSIHNLFSIQNTYQSKNKRYDLKIAFIYNGIKNEENGGWSQTDVFTNPFYKKNKSFVSVHLDDASNRYNERNVNLHQQINLGKKVATQINDSTTRKIVKQAKYAIVHDFELSHWKFIYKDFEKDSSFYSSLIFDEDSTHDATKTWKLSNAIYFKNNQQDSHPKKFLFAIGAQYDFIKYQQRYTNEFTHDIQLKAKIYNQTDLAFFGYTVTAAIDLAPKYIGDFEFNFLGKLNFKKDISVALAGNVSLASPTRKQDSYLGNHYAYHTDFKKTFQVLAQAEFAWKKQLLFATIQNYFIQNYIYNDTASLPAQYNKPLNALVVKFRKDFNTKHIYSGTELYAQWISNRDIVRLPVFAMKQTLYYKGGWISGKLNAQLGFDIMYNTNFKGNAYNPALAEFYLQNKETLKFYPIMDLFFRLQVKFTNIFFRVEHVNQGMFKQKGIFTAPNYGYLDRTFRVGVLWQFYD